MPTNESDYNKVFTELIKKQILILGPEITLAKVKNVPGLIVDANGVVTNIQGDPQILLQNLINQFVELSGMIVKKTMESILTSYPNIAGLSSFAPSSVETSEGKKASEGQGSLVQSNQQTQQAPPPTQQAPPVQEPIQSAPVQPQVEPVPVAPISMPSVESIQANPAPAPIQPPVPMPPVEPTPPPPKGPPILEVTSVKPAEPTSPNVQTAQVPTQPVSAQAPTPNPASGVHPTSDHDDLSQEEIEKLNKMIAEMNQMDEKKQ